MNRKCECSGTLRLSLRLPSLHPYGVSKDDSFTTSGSTSPRRHILASHQRGEVRALLLSFFRIIIYDVEDIGYEKFITNDICHKLKTKEKLTVPGDLLTSLEVSVCGYRGLVESLPWSTSGPGVWRSGKGVPRTKYCP